MPRSGFRSIRSGRSTSAALARAPSSAEREQRGDRAPPHSAQPIPSGPAVSKYFGLGHDFTQTGRLQPALPFGTT